MHEAQGAQGEQRRFETLTQRDLSVLMKSISQSLLAIPHHPNIIPLYDAFLMPGEKKMLHFVFECMEGNLYQLTKSRKGRPLASGLVASIFQQIIRGLHHIHEHGYFHRDMKPENLLITTTGLADYPAYAPFAPRGTAPERDVLVIVKLADFGLARETQSAPPYTEYVSTRWYRAPEILLRARDYSSPVDIWALGTILAELLNLKPLFPGQTEVDQVLYIVEILGNPSSEYGKDERGRLRGGGDWARGLRLAEKVGFEFPKVRSLLMIISFRAWMLTGPLQASPMNFANLFSAKVPAALVDCIQDMMRYEPQARLTTRDCLNHVYYREIAPKLLPLQAKELAIATEPTAQLRQVPRAQLQPIALPDKTMGMDPNAGRRQVPPSHSAMPQSVRPAFGAGTSAHDMARLQQQQQQDQPMAAASPMRTGPTHDTGPVDAPMDAASPKELNDVQWAPAPGSGVRDSTISQISQYPAFPDSASLYAGSHASMQFDDVSLRPPQAYQGEAGSDAQFSTSTVRDVRQYNPQVQRTSAVMPPRRPEEEQWVNRQAQQGLPAQTQDNGSDLADSNASNETLGSRDRRRSKTWGLNISSVFTGNSSGSGPVLKQPTGQQWDPTPAQQLVAEQQPQFLTSQAQQQAAFSSASLPNSAPVQSSSKPLDPKKAKKEAEKKAREAEKAKRTAQEKAARDRARAVMQKRNQILAASNNRDQVEWLDNSLADNDVTRALAQSDKARGKQPSSSMSSYSSTYGGTYGGGPSPASESSGSSLFSPQAPSHQHLAGLSSPGLPRQGMRGGVHGSSAFSRGPGRYREYDDERSLSSFDHDDPRRQSMQSFQTGDSDPGPGGRYVHGNLANMQRQGSASSLNSAPGVIDASGRRLVDYRTSHDNRSVASSLDQQLVQDFGNTTVGDVRQRDPGSVSPGPHHLYGTRTSVSRQSHGSRASSAHRQGSASPLHQTPAPRFHPYSHGPGPSISSTHSGSAHSYQLPPLPQVPIHGGGDGAPGPFPHRPRSVTRRSSQSAHRGISRGSVGSQANDSVQRPLASPTTHLASVNPMFQIPRQQSQGATPSPQPPQLPLPGVTGQAPLLPPFSQLAQSVPMSPDNDATMYGPSGQGQGQGYQR